MARTVVASGSMTGFTFESIKYGEEVLHWVKVVGPIDLAKRLPLYRATLEINPSSHYYCILDNTDGHDNNFTFSDMKMLDDMLVEAGIEKFYGATVSSDRAYSGLVKLANTSVEMSKLGGELLATDSVEEAEHFIFSKLQSGKR